VRLAQQPRVPWVEVHLHLVLAPLVRHGEDRGRVGVAAQQPHAHDLQLETRLGGQRAPEQPLFQQIVHTRVPFAQPAAALAQLARVEPLQLDLRVHHRLGRARRVLGKKGHEVRRGPAPRQWRHRRRRCFVAAAAAVVRGSNTGDVCGRPRLHSGSW